MLRKHMLNNHVYKIRNYASQLRYPNICRNVVIFQIPQSKTPSRIQIVDNLYVKKG